MKKISHPICDEDKKSKHYKRGISCGFCYGKKSTKGVQRAAERQKQVEIHEQRNKGHIGKNISYA